MKVLTKSLLVICLIMSMTYVEAQSDECDTGTLSETLAEYSDSLADATYEEVVSIADEINSLMDDYIQNCDETPVSGDNSVDAESRARQIEAFNLSCMDVLDFTREDCGNFSAYVVDDEELGPVVANCTDYYFGNLESFNVCVQDVYSEVELRINNAESQRAFLYGYCTGQVVDSTPSLEAMYTMPDDECRQWVIELDFLHPALMSRQLCWDTDDAFDILWPNLDKDETLDLWRTIVECMAENLGDDFPEIPQK